MAMPRGTRTHQLEAQKSLAQEGLTTHQSPSTLLTLPQICVPVDGGRGRGEGG
jgi:hypothetical protein